MPVALFWSSTHDRVPFEIEKQRLKLLFCWPLWVATHFYSDDTGVKGSLGSSFLPSSPFPSIFLVGFCRLSSHPTSVCDEAVKRSVTRGCRDESTEEEANKASRDFPRRENFAT